jgi:hypothetical protein
MIEARKSGEAWTSYKVWLRFWLAPSHQYLNSPNRSLVTRIIIVLCPHEALVLHSARDGPEQEDCAKRFKANNTFTPQKTWDGVQIGRVPGSFNDLEWTPWRFNHGALAFVSLRHIGFTRTLLIIT